MRLTAHSICLAVLATVGFSSYAVAQEASPKTFYKRDYASAPGAQGREYERPNSSANNSKNANGASKRNASGNGGKINSPEKKRRRVAVSVYVNSKDQEHFKRVLAEILSLHDSQRAFITTVQHIGDYHTVTPEQKEELLKRNIMLLASSEPPSEAKVTMSPAWIITTKNGPHIAEGIISLTPLFNEYGEYDPNLANKSVDRAKVEGF